MIIFRYLGQSTDLVITDLPLGIMKSTAFSSPPFVGIISPAQPHTYTISKKIVKILALGGGTFIQSVGTNTIRVPEKFQPLPPKIILGLRSARKESASPTLPN